ncbi:Modulator of apoptosis 1 [Merluccius polli]|uniref:Modulator of apoptosis 1 n=1 Tax=Merluccius polli TaxID=89951 RepID=A0AA47MZR0_MERPO|nr:Modulator of apoptosis 1 [Merluccius polli]
MQPTCLHRDSSHFQVVSQDHSMNLITTPGDLDPSISDLQRSRKILESLFPPAADMVRHLRSETPPMTYLQILDSAYGTVQDGDELYTKFMELFQDAGENPSAYLQRLQVALDLAVKRGGVLATELDRHLLNQFCRGCWDNTLISELQLKQRKSHPPSFAELLLLLRTEEDRGAAKVQRMKQHLSSKARAGFPGDWQVNPHLKFQQAAPWSLRVLSVQIYHQPASVLSSNSHPLHCLEVCVPQTRSLKKPAVDPEEYLSEEEEGRIAQVSIPAAVMFSVGGTLPAQLSSTNLALAEPMHSPAKKMLDVEEPSLVTGAVDPPLLSVEEDVSGASEEENGEYLPEPEEVSSIPDTLPSEGDGELDGPVETSADSVVQPQHAAEIPVTVLDSGGGGGGDLDVGEPGQSIRRSSRQRQPPKRLQYTGLGSYRWRAKGAYGLTDCCTSRFPPARPVGGSL